MATSADFNANNMAGYHNFTTESGDKHGSFYVFFVAESELPATVSDESAVEPFALITQPGWYWQAEFPGCLPDGEPNGPFNTSGAAYSDANSNA